MTNLQVTSAYPNYYGSSSPNQKYLGQSRSPDTQRIPGYHNYGYHSEMREVNNSYTVPQVCIEDADVRFFLFSVDIFRCIFRLDQPISRRKNFSFAYNVILCILYEIHVLLWNICFGKIYN